MLKLRFKNNKLNTVWLVEPKVSIGRSLKSDLLIDSPEIEEHHADVVVKHETLTLVNVSGSADLKLNGKSIEKAARLKVNDELTLGRTVLQIVDPKAEFAKNPPKKTPLRASGWALKPNHSALANRVFTIKEHTVIGRSNECDITIAAAHLSRRHVQLNIRDGLLFVKDLGSANGTYLNGEPVTEARVKRGDELRFDTLCFGVIGPVEDTDKTTIRRVDPALASGDLAPKTPQKKPRNTHEQIRRIRPESNSSNDPEQLSDTNKPHSEQSPSQKRPILLGIILIAAAAAVFAYIQGIFGKYLP